MAKKKGKRGPVIGVCVAAFLSGCEGMSYQPECDHHCAGSGGAIGATNAATQ